MQQRVAVLKDDILHAKESLNRIEARMTQKDLLDQAAILISGRRVPPANPDMDWERETDGIMIETLKLEGRVSKCLSTVHPHNLVLTLYSYESEGTVAPGSSSTIQLRVRNVRHEPVSHESIRNEHRVRG